MSYKQVCRICLEHYNSEDSAIWGIVDTICLSCNNDLKEILQSLIKELRESRKVKSQKKEDKMLSIVELLEVIRVAESIAASPDTFADKKRRDQYTALADSAVAEIKKLLDATTENKVT